MSVRLCGLRVFVDEAAKDRSSLDLCRRSDSVLCGRYRWLLGEGAMWTVLVVVTGVFGQDGGQVSFAEDE
jgi:hypothetical protein